MRDKDVKFLTKKFERVETPAKKFQAVSSQLVRCEETYRHEGINW
jgi:hypothetical protein